LKRNAGEVIITHEVENDWNEDQLPAIEVKTLLSPRPCAVKPRSRVRAILPAQNNLFTDSALSRTYERK
jgi:hypothetical protein